MNKRLALMALAAFIVSGALSLTAKTGTDNQAVKLVGELTKGSYTPRSHSLWTPSGGWTEALLFGVQAFTGTYLFGYVILQLKEERKKGENAL